MAKTFFGLALLFGVTVTNTSGAIDLATQRNVRGVITAVEAGSLTIQAGSANKGVTGRIDPKTTRIFVGQVPGRVTDLHHGSVAAGELTLDETWETIRVSR
jgi:hypothetical protein